MFGFSISPSSTGRPASVLARLTKRAAALAVYDVSDRTSLFKPDGSLAGAGQLVGKILNVKNRATAASVNYNLSSPSSSQAPMISGGLLFDGVDDILTSQTPGGNNRTVVSVYRGTDALAVLLSNANGAGDHFIWQSGGSSTNSSGASGATVDGVAAPATRGELSALMADNRPHIVTVPGLPLGSYGGMMFGASSAYFTTPHIVGGNLIPISILDANAPDYPQALREAQSFARQLIRRLAL